VKKRPVASPFPTARKFRVPEALSRPRGDVTPPRAPRSEAARQLGEQVRALRIASGVSGGALARSSGVSRSMLSRIERGLVSPSVETLERLARGLDAPLSRLFSDQAQRRDLSFVPAGGGIMIDRTGVVAGYRYELLGHLLSGNFFVEPYLVRLTPEAQPYTSFQHPGIKFLYLVSGRIRYRYGGKAMALQSGDSLLFDATALHGVEGIEEAPVSYLSVVFTMRD
jgi:transcriptional regulator with XRE-family HTH domain